MNNSKKINLTLIKLLIVPTLVIALAYVILTVYLTNYRLLLDTLFSNHTFEYRRTVLVNLLPGTLTSMTVRSLIVLLTIAFLVGVNLSLLGANYVVFSGKKSLSFLAGGSLLGLLGNSCPTCGVPLLVFVGLSSLIFVLPFRGQELSFVSLILLVISLYLLMRRGLCLKS